MKNKFILFAVVIFLSFCFVIFYKGLNISNNYSPKVNEKKNIPTFNAKDFVSGNDISSDKIFGKNIFYIVNIWSSWCVPCRTEHPLLMQLSKNKSIELVGLNYRDNFNNAKKFIDEFGNPYSRILIDKDGALGIEFGAYGVPETFLIDKDKDIIKKFVGPIDQEIVNEIKLIIK
jgi:cytochrome c biogenesis protein CcmG/thiol:disulfide interchange protein DsbE|tara:strand:+ start:122 stop:643 length:522 start_codon:yes stop_codon:yes gene_type:complete